VTVQQSPDSHLFVSCPRVAAHGVCVLHVSLIYRLLDSSAVGAPLGVGRARRCHTCRVREQTQRCCAGLWWWRSRPREGCALGEEVGKSAGELEVRGWRPGSAVAVADLQEDTTYVDGVEDDGSTASRATLG
jgi:hypothetical protein